MNFLNPRIYEITLAGMESEGQFTVVIIYCCIKNYPKPLFSKTTNSYYLSCYEVRTQEYSSWDFCLEVAYEATVKVSTGAAVSSDGSPGEGLLCSQDWRDSAPPWLGKRLLQFLALCVSHGFHL